MQKWAESISGGIQDYLKLGQVCQKLDRGKGTLRTMGASSVQEVAEVEQGVSRCQELEESLQEKMHTQG